MGVFQNALTNATVMLSGGSNVAVPQHEYAELHGEMAAIYDSQAVLRLAPDGTILEANALFLQLIGYTLGELAGKPHTMLV